MNISNSNLLDRVILPRFSFIHVPALYTMVFHLFAKIMTIKSRLAHHSAPKYVPQYDPKRILSDKYHHHGGFVEG
jgi:hypothetical protein